MSFKQEFSKEERKQESERIQSKYEDRIPVIVERGKSSSVPDIDKKKYLVPSDLTCGQFLYVVRKRLKIGPTEAIYLFTQEGTIPSSSSLMADLYQEQKDDDGFLYLLYSGENVFG